MYMQQLLALCISVAAVSADTVAKPAITQAAYRRNAAPVDRRQAPSSLCVSIPGVNGCVGADGKGSGNLPAVNSALNTATSVASAISSAASAAASNPAKATPSLVAGATNAASAASAVPTNLSSLANGQLPKATGMSSSSMGGMSGMGGMAGMAGAPAVPKAGTPPPFSPMPAGGMAGMAGMPGMNMPGMTTPSVREPIPVATGKASGGMASISFRA